MNAEPRHVEAPRMWRQPSKDRVAVVPRSTCSARAEPSPAEHWSRRNDVAEDDEGKRKGRAGDGDVETERCPSRTFDARRDRVACLMTNLAYARAKRYYTV